MIEMILDASALIAMLKGEAGGTKVARALSGARIGVVNYAEVVSHFIRAGMPSDQIDAMLGPLPLTLVPADEELARMAGHLRSLTADVGLSLGDRFCLALAKRDMLPAMTADRAWKELEEACGVSVQLIR